jgi:hypothetical protein
VSDDPTSRKVKSEDAQDKPMAGLQDPFDALDGYMEHTRDSGSEHLSLDHLSVSDRHFSEHLRLLKWYQEDLRSQRVAFARIKTMLTRDLEAIDRAIWAREEEDKWRKDTQDTERSEPQNEGRG